MTLGRAALRREVEQLGHQRHAGHAVDHRVVHLGDQPDPAVGQALDDVHLPWGLLKIERAPHHLGRLGAQLHLAARGRQGDPVQVVVEVEGGIVDPAGVIEPERDRHQAAPEREQRGHPVGQHGPDGLEGVATRSRHRVEDADVRHLHRGEGRVGVDEHRVYAGHSLHGSSSTSW